MASSEQPIPPPNTAANSHPPPPQPPQPPPGSSTKKRSLDYYPHLQSSPYFKIRAVLSDLRPLFLEVLRAPDFRNCEAAHGIQEKMNLMLDLCREATPETTSVARCNNTTPLPRENHSALKPMRPPPDVKPSTQLHQADRVAPKPNDDKRLPSVDNPENQPQNDGFTGTYIVGGSAFGWNFIMYHGSKPVYYGRTKEAFRAANPII